MPEITLFLASSSAARAQARAVSAALSTKSISFLPWWEAFTAGRTLLAELESLRGKVHGALLILSPESSTSIRGKTVDIPNLNVLFEFGFYLGAFPKERVAIVKYGEYYLPSDLGGYIHIAGSSSFRRGGATKVGKRAKEEFTRWTESPEFHTPPPRPISDLITTPTTILVGRRSREELLGLGRSTHGFGLGG